MNLFLNFRHGAFFPLALLGLVFFGQTAQAGDPVAGKAVAAQICQTCHGMDGVGTMPMVANLAGQQELYMIAQLKAYSSGKRHHEQMSIIVKMLKPGDIENVAAWYAGLKVTIEMPQ